MTFFFHVSESESLKSLPVQNEEKSVTLVEDDFLFSLSSDYEDFDAEATDKKYEKLKEVKDKKTKNSKKKKKNDAISDSFIPTLVSTLDPVPILVRPLMNEGDKPVFILDEDENTPKAESKEGQFKEPNKFRSKSTVYNKSPLTGW